MCLGQVLSQLVFGSQAQYHHGTMEVRFTSVFFQRPYECPAEGCSRSYTRQQHLKRHLETTHVGESGEEKIKCDDCDKMFSNKYSLRKHHYRYHVRTPFTCSECGQTFKKQQHLKTHTFVHTGIKPYKCEFPGCDVRCENPSRLKRHSFIHEKSRYACPIENCGNTFDLYHNLQMHLSISHMKGTAKLQ
ncbi:zinc finger protein 99-like [Penaeus monodon]|uniref:zinc finger protein 99-like n=1 Tax=Penaeus monodon TaxID=6687 RepID=UPI0018A7850F|nr:zinc finger protein 99-like [Penaeus monodon]